MPDTHSRPRTWRPPRTGGSLPTDPALFTLIDLPDTRRKPERPLLTELPATEIIPFPLSRDPDAVTERIIPCTTVAIPLTAEHARPEAAAPTASPEGGISLGLLGLLGVSLVAVALLMGALLGAVIYLILR